MWYSSGHKVFYNMFVIVFIKSGRKELKQNCYAWTSRTRSFPINFEDFIKKNKTQNDTSIAHQINWDSKEFNLFHFIKNTLTRSSPLKMATRTATKNSNMPPGGDLIFLSSDEFTLPATISCDATVLIEDKDINVKQISWFRFTSKKKRWGKTRACVMH